MRSAVSRTGPPDADKTGELRQGPVRRASPSGPDWDFIDDPSADGWDSEAFDRRAKKQRGRLAAWLADPALLDTADAAGLATPTFECSALVPDALSETFDDDVFKVKRAECDGSERPVHFGPEGLVEALRVLVEPFDAIVGDTLELKPVSVEMKPVSVELDGTRASTRLLVALSGRSSSGAVERHTTWLVGWEDAQSEMPKIRSLRVERFEESRRAGKPLFEDHTASVLGAERAFEEQLAFGFNHWIQRIPGRDYFYLLGTPAIAVGDVDGDGRDDLFIGQQTGLPNLLVLQRPDGSGAEVSREAGLDWLQGTRGALLLDLDDDGDQDLVAGLVGTIVVAENDGSGHFSIASVTAVNDDVMSLSAADFDHDGDLDVYVCAYVAALELAFVGANVTSVYQDAQNGAANHLLRNEGGLQFVDVTAEVGLDDGNSRYSFASSWEDFDDDGDQDLYVANDYGRNNLYRNDDGRFVDIAAEAKVEDQASGMSVAWGDYDRDGRMDLYVSNMFSSAGNRIAHQDRFLAGASDDVKERIQRFARGNSLFRNEGGTGFADRSLEAEVNVGRWAWSSNFVDVNNDGWEDLVVANGYITTEDTNDL
jgi:hypothetical protein